MPRRFSTSLIININPLTIGATTIWSIVSKKKIINTKFIFEFVDFSN